MWKKLLLGFLGLVVAALIILFGYVQFTWNQRWDVPLPALQASTDPEVIARGEYLVRGPAHCSNCHVESLEAMARSDAGERLPLKGGVVFDMGPIGVMQPGNLTPDKETGIGQYSDGQLFRMLRNAVKPDGTATISVMMPFQDMADEDHIAIVSFLRSLPPVRNKVPGPVYGLMGKALRSFLTPFKPVLDPHPPEHAPKEAATKERGEYLARSVANCYACHTNIDPVTVAVIGPDFGGGAEIEPLPLPGVDRTLWFHPPNLTSHDTGALKNFPTREAWIARFRAGRVYPGSPMHWGPFSRMSDADLSALWIFLNSLPPADNDTGPRVFKKEP